MWAKHPKIAKRWTKKYGSKIVKSKKKKKRKKQLLLTTPYGELNSGN